jgi:hypothetical protein
VTRAILVARATVRTMDPTSGYELWEPSRAWTGAAFVFPSIHHDPCAMKQQSPEIAVPPFADTEQERFAPSGLLAWDQAHPSSQVTPIVEQVGLRHCRLERCRNHRPHTLDGGQALTRFRASAHLGNLDVHPVTTLV